MCLAVQTLQGPPGEEKKREGKRKGKGRSKRTGRAFFGDEQAQDPEWWQEEDPVWWSKWKKGKEGLSKGNDGFRQGGFRPYKPDKFAGKHFHQNKGSGKDQKKERQRRNLSSVQVFSLRNSQRRRIWSGLGIRRLVCQSLD